MRASRFVDRRTNQVSAVQRPERGLLCPDGARPSLAEWILVATLVVGATVAVMLSTGGWAAISHAQGRPPQFSVNSVADRPDIAPGNGLCDTINPGECTLRAAVMEANARDGNETIALPAGTFTLTRPGQGEDAALTGDLDLTDPGDSVTITGVLEGDVLRTTIDGGHLDRVFEVHLNTRLVLSRLQIQHGDAGAGEGGAARVATGGTLELVDSAVLLNHARFGGGIALAIGAEGRVTDSEVRDNASDSNGGGVHNQGVLVLDRAEVRGNDAGARGGGVHSLGTLRLTDTSFRDNTAGSNASGGGIASLGSNADLIMTGGTLIQNSTGNNGGALVLSGIAVLTDVLILANTADRGAGISSAGTVTMRETQVSDNTAGSDGGGWLVVEGSVTIGGSQIQGKNAATTGGGMQVLSGTVMLADQSTVRGNTALLSSNDSGGGGVQIDGGVVHIADSEVIGNTAAGSGGGILTDEAGTLTVTDGSVANNTAQHLGGGIRNLGDATLTDVTVERNTANGNGGGVHNSGTLTVTGGSVSQNKASISVNLAGGGIWNHGTVSLTGVAVDNNISLNGTGGGLINFSPPGTTAIAVLVDSTVNGNTGGTGIGGISNSGTLSLERSEVSRNVAERREAFRTADR